MKKIILSFILLISLNAFAQQKENLENEIKEDSKLENKDSLNRSLTVNYESILYKSGDYLQKSAYYEYADFSSFAAGIGLMWVAFNNFDFWSGDDGNIATSAFSAVAAILFFTSAIACTIASIRYDKKAGKELKLFMRGETGTIVITF